ncbi:MAG: acyl-CoA dehydrogenase family protein [Chloroflexi bacterium]|nr:acyl-CoA dehydrogenase family protein [Chloroflexota bacterium]
MEFGFTPAQEAFRQEVREFFTRELPAGWVGYEEGAETRDDWWAFAKQLMRKLGERRWLAVHWPQEYGGLGLTPIDHLIYKEEAYYHLVPEGPTHMARDIVAPSIIIYGTEEQKRKYLIPIAAGEIGFCQGFSEPGAGSDLAGLQTRAMEDGDGFVINGQKIFTSRAHRADYCWLAARTDPAATRHRGLSTLVVDMKTPGITVRPLMNMMRAHSFNEVFFDNVRVPRDALVGTKDRGWYQMMTTLDFERSGIDHTAAGRRLLDEMMVYAQETRRNGMPLAQDPKVRNRLAEMAVHVEVSRLLCYRVYWMHSQGKVPSHEASTSKVFGDEFIPRLVNLATQIVGLPALLQRDSKWAPLAGSLERLYLSSVGATFARGTSEIQRNIIAGRGLGLPRG